jgi:hypothetical protein
MVVEVLGYTHLVADLSSLNVKHVAADCFLQNVVFQCQRFELKQESIYVSLLADSTLHQPST